MRLGPMTVFLFVLYLSMGIFDQTLSSDLNAYGNGGTSFVFLSLIQPWNWGGTTNVLGYEVPNFLGILGSAITIAVGIAVLGSVLGRSDITTLFALFLSMMSLGAMPIIMFYGFITRNISPYACTIGTACLEANILGALSAGVLGIMWLYTCLEWWAWRNTTA
jgi:hypothetical protein